MLHNTTVLVGAGGGPLTWVAVDVLRALQRAGAQVRVVLSTHHGNVYTGINVSNADGW